MAQNQSESANLEIEYLIQASAFPFRQHNRDKLKALLLLIEVKRLHRFIQYHSIETLIFQQLKGEDATVVPKELLEQLKGTSQTYAMHKLAQAAALKKLNKLLLAHNIPFIFYKGLLFTDRVYGDISSRDFSDIDLIIQKSDLDALTALLIAEGYQPRITDERLREITLKYGCEFNFVKYENGHRLALEPHWAFFRSFINPPIKFSDLTIVSQEIKSLGIKTNGLSDEWMVLAMLYHHGGNDMWYSLKYVSDINRAVINLPKLDWDLIKDISKKHKLYFLVLISLSIANKVYNTPIPHSLITDCNRANIKTQTSHFIKFMKQNEKSKFAVDLGDRVFFHVKNMTNPLDRILILFRYGVYYIKSHKSLNFFQFTKSLYSRFSRTAAR